ncbi:MAG: hypothetical protein LBT48_04625 [Prevotellaceae bacterium]|jgi:hypothetical protein|nr:hypothetical protein [Prevotellaceae bacterium]
MKKIVTILLFCCTAQLIFAQADAALLQQAETHIANYDYKAAIRLLEPASRRKNVRLITYILLADCYLATDQKDKALSCYEKVVAAGENGENVMPGVFLHYGELLMYKGKYPQAKEHLQSYYNSTAHSEQWVQALITSCDSATVWQNWRDSIFQVTNPKELNSKFNDWGATFQKTNIVYVSNRPRKSESEFDEYSNAGFYTAYRSAIFTEGKYGRLEMLLKNDAHIGPVAFSKDGETMYYTQNNTNVSHHSQATVGIAWENQLEIQIAKINDKTVTDVKSFAYNKPREYSTGHACISPDGKVLYFVSDMPGGYGGTDIYYSVFENNGWSEPKNAGQNINTSGNEMFPTMDNSGVLYFSSNGRIGLGGLDIYRANGSKNNWTTPENMYNPINSSGDDFYFSLSPNKKTGYFSSNRAGGAGSDDIYAVTVSCTLPEMGNMKSTWVSTITGKAGDFKTTETTKTTEPTEKVTMVTSEKAAEQTINIPNQKQEVIQEAIQEVVFTSNVVNLETKKGIANAVISFVDNKTKKQVVVKTNEAGVVSAPLNSNATYTYSCISEGYVPVIGQILSGDDIRQGKGLRIELTPVKAKVENVIADNVILDTDDTSMGIEYRVQVMASKDYPDWNYLDNIRKWYPEMKIMSKVSPDYTRFTVGSFKTLVEATILKNKLRHAGYHDAFVVMFENGKRKVISYN